MTTLVRVLAARTPILVAVLLPASVLAIAGSARADAVPPGDVVQISTRLAIGGGADFPALRDVGGIFELALRADALFGDPVAGRARIGPAIDVRTATFGSLELAGGLIGLLPLGWDFALTLTVGAGYAFRDQGRDGAVAITTVTASFRPYDHFDAYGEAIGIYVGGRAGFAGWETWEITAGLEIDLELVFVAPIRFLITATRGGDPHEEESAAEAEVTPDR